MPPTRQRRAGRVLSGFFAGVLLVGALSAEHGRLAWAVLIGALLAGAVLTVRGEVRMR